MADIYTSLQVSPRKKRCPPSPDDNTFTPKKLRISPLTPPATGTRKANNASPSILPTHLSRLFTIQTGIQHALSHALATCAVSPSETGIIRNVLNHFSLTSYSGLSTTFSIDDLKRLCWLWEWDGKALPKLKKHANNEEEDNPFLEEEESDTLPKEWSRSGMGFVITPATHNTGGRRVPAYGIGIEVELDIDKDMAGGIAAVARWTADSQSRRQDVQKKMEKWVQLHVEEDVVPVIPMADLPPLPVTSNKQVTASRPFLSASPTKLNLNVLSTPSRTPSRSPTRSPTRSPRKSPTKHDFIVPSAPVTPSINRVAKPTFPSTPTSSSGTPRINRVTRLTLPSTPSSSSSGSPAATPRANSSGLSSDSDEPSTPTHNRGRAPATPSTARQQALYERIRGRSASPTKQLGRAIGGNNISREQMLRLGQEQMRKRCLLGRLSGIAESVYMLFSAPTAAVTNTPSRKRRALPLSDVAPAIVKSSPVPISIAEAQESLRMLMELCPFFLRPMTIAGAEWLEMPAPSSTASRVPSIDDDKYGAVPSTPSKKTKTRLPINPTSLNYIVENEADLVNRSPRRVKCEAGGLREVREVIRKELESQD